MCLLAREPIFRTVAFCTSRTNRPITRKAIPSLLEKMLPSAIKSCFTAALSEIAYLLAWGRFYWMEDDVMIGAGSLVPQNKRLESGYLYLGSPVKQIRPLKEAEIEGLKYSANNYVKWKNDYLDQDSQTQP